MQPFMQWKSYKYYKFQVCVVCVFVALGIQHAIHMCRIVICGLTSSTTFFHIIS